MPWQGHYRIFQEQHAYADRQVTERYLQKLCLIELLHDMFNMLCQIALNAWHSRCLFLIQFFYWILVSCCIVLDESLQVFHCTVYTTLYSMHMTNQLWFDDQWIKERENRRNHSACIVLTVADRAPCNLPQDQAKGPDVHSLEGLKAVHLDGVVQDLWGHVALRAHFRVVAHV